MINFYFFLHLCSHDANQDIEPSLHPRRLPHASPQKQPLFRFLSHHFVLPILEFYVNHNADNVFFFFYSLVFKQNTQNCVKWKRKFFPYPRLANLSSQWLIVVQVVYVLPVFPKAVWRPYQEGCLAWHWACGFPPPVLEEETCQLRCVQIGNHYRPSLERAGAGGSIVIVLGERGDYF